jgi:hypothetical protein
MPTSKVDGANMSLRVYVDYNTIRDDDRGRVHINTTVYKELLNQLIDGMALTLYDDESMEVEAIAEFDEARQWWYAIPDWSTRRDLPP